MRVLKCDLEKNCPLSVLIDVHIRRIIFEKIYELFVGTLETVSYIRVSEERGSTVPYLSVIFRYV